MKHLLNLTRRIQSAATRAHVKALCFVADKADAKIDNADVLREAANDALDKAVGRYVAANEAIKDSVRQAEATRHAAIVEADRLGFAI